MFKKFIQEIIDTESIEYLVNNVFYGINGIEMAYQEEEISNSEFEMLSNLIDKMIELKEMKGE